VCVLLEVPGRKGEPRGRLESSFTRASLPAVRGIYTPHVGERRSIQHSFTVEEVRAFAEASGDRGLQHVAPDHEGRLMVHGLLLGMLPTRVGGRLNFLAREMSFEFLHPVFTGDTVRCEVVLTQWEPTALRTLVRAEWACLNQEGVAVMRGRAAGIVRASDARKRSKRGSIPAAVPEVSDTLIRHPDAAGSRKREHHEETAGPAK